MNSVVIIAEAGVNHNGNEQLAYSLIDAAVEAGVDIVKFQTFKAKNLVTSSAEKALYQQQNDGMADTQYQMLKRLELSFDAHRRIKKYCNEKGIKYLSTAFDLDSLDFLVNDLKLEQLKLSSGDLTNAPFLLAHALTGKSLIVSTGMATMAEVLSALQVIAFGLMQSKGELLDYAPNETSFKLAYKLPLAKKLLAECVTLLHCTTDYPTPMTDINLLAMTELATEFKLNIGYSDHSAGIHVPIAATALAASIIEKHFTLDKTMEGPDHKASLNPNELKEMVSAIRNIECAMGDGVKKPTLTELGNRTAARKSLVAASDIEKGEPLTDTNVAIKRPGDGMSPNRYWDIVGTVASCTYKEGELLNE